MESKFDELYNLIYSPIITPGILSENAKLENYNYVKYYREYDNLVVSMECKLGNNEVAIFNYYFDKKDMLNKVMMKTQKETSVIFDRKLEIEKIKSDLIDERYQCTKEEAI